MRSALVKPEIVVCAAALVACLATFGGRLRSVDEIAVYGVAYSLAQRGALDIDLLASSAPGMREPPFTGVGDFGPDGHFYSGKGVLPSILAVPLVKLALAAPGGDPVVAALLVNVILTALTAAVVTRCLREAGAPAWLAATGGLVYALGSMAWAYSKRLFTEPAAALSVALAWRWIMAMAPGRVGRAGLAVGLALGGAVAASYSNAVLLPMFAVLLAYRALRSVAIGAVSSISRAGQAGIALGGLIAGLLPWVIGLSIYNAARFGAPTQTGLSLLEWSAPYFSWPAALTRMYALLLSPYRGLLFYNPIVLLAVAGLVGAPWMQPRRRAPVFAAAAGTLIYLVFFSFWSMWWGGYNWGPRFLAPILPLWAIAAGATVTEALRAPVIPRRLALAAAAIVACVSIGVSGVGAVSNTFITEGDLAMRGMLGPLVKPESLSASPLLTDPAFFQAVSGWEAMRRHGPEVWWRMPSPVDVALEQSLADISARITPDSAVVVVAPARLEQVLHAYRLPAPLIGLAPDQMRQGDDGPARWLLKRSRLFLLTDAAQTDPANTTEQWLSARAFRARNEFFDPWRVAAFGVSGTLLPLARGPVEFGGGRLRAARVSVGSQTTAGGSVALMVEWERRVSSDDMAGLAWFAHLLDSGGNLVSQHDALVGGGFGWQPANAVSLTDRRGILVPPTVMPGRYRVRIGVYGPDGTRYPATLEGVPLPENVIDFEIDIYP